MLCRNMPIKSAIAFISITKAEFLGCTQARYCRAINEAD